jgi:carbon storage regulator
MLVLTRSRNQTIRVGHDICIRIVGVNGNQVRLGVEAPKHVSVDREEIHLLKQQSVSRGKASTSDER